MNFRPNEKQKELVPLPFFSFASLTSNLQRHEKNDKKHHSHHFFPHNHLLQLLRPMTTLQVNLEV